MAENTSKMSTELVDLSTKLLGSLDEHKFFNELIGHISSMIPNDRVLAYKVIDEASGKLVAMTGDHNIDFGDEDAIAHGPVGHVIRTKRPYYSNNVERDPLFSERAKDGIISELCIPVSHEGILIATIHIQGKSESIQFSRSQITQVLGLFSELQAPIANMKMYLTAKSLNEVLLRTIEQREAELEEKSSNVFTVAPGGKIKENEIVGKSEIMANVMKMADKVAMSEVNVLISGEAGCGKETFARRVHCRSNRSENSFMTIDCSSLAHDALEREIFGSVTLENGQPRTVQGLLELASGGTLYIESLGALPASLQAKMSTFLKEGLIFRVGEKVPYRSNVRIIASHTSSLEQLVDEGKFRQDLFYLVNTMSLKVPSLSERQEDIEELAYYFLNNNKNITEQKSFSPGVLSALREYRWPGNIRELQNVIERAYVLSEGQIIEKAHLASHLIEVEAVEVEKDERVHVVGLTLDELERQHICATLAHLSGNKTKTAKTLGITVKTLYNKLHSYGMIQPKEA